MTDAPPPDHEGAVEKDPDQTRFCDECGTLVVPTAEACQNCGATLAISDPTVAQTNEPEPDASSEQAPPESRKWPDRSDFVGKRPEAPRFGPLTAEDSGLIYRRIGAYVLDSVLVSIAALVVLGATNSLGSTDDPAAVDPMLAVWALALEVLYRWAMQATFGFTVGKLALGLRLVGPDGKPASAVQILIRELALIGMLGVAQLVGNLIVPALVQIGLIYTVIRRPDRRSLHDLTVQTRVVRVASPDRQDETV